MAHITDAEFAELVKKAEPILKALPPEDEDLFDEGIDQLSARNFGKLDPGGDTPENATIREARETRDKAGTWLQAFIEQVPKPETPIGPVIRTRNYTDRQNRITTDKFDASGNLVERQQMSREDSENVRNFIEDTADKRETIRLNTLEVNNLRAAAASATDPEASAALRGRANALEQQNQDEFQKLRESIPSEEWISYDLGPSPEPVSDSRATFLAAVDAKDVRKMKTAFFEMDRRDQYLSWEKVAGTRRGQQLLEEMTLLVEAQE